jgi:GAF domain-containing protein
VTASGEPACSLADLKIGQTVSAGCPFTSGGEIRVDVAARSFAFSSAKRVLPDYRCAGGAMCDPDDSERWRVTNILETELREIKEGLIATVVGVGVDDFATNRLVERMTADPEALASVIQFSLSQSARVAALDGTGLMSADSKATLDSVASLTAEALAAPFAAVSLLDGERQFLAGSNVALEADARWRPVGQSICQYTVVSGIPFIVDDATVHPLLANHPAVLSGEVGAYAGVPLFSEDDHAVGTLYIWDNRPRRWTSGQIIVLQDMADLAGAKIFHRPI